MNSGQDQGRGSPPNVTLQDKAFSDPQPCINHASTLNYASIWIKRSFEDKISHLATQRPIIVLTGARQTGKTSPLKRLFPKHSFVSLDLPAEAEFAEKEPEAFLKKYPAPLIVDEVQYAPGLFRHLKTQVDLNRKNYGSYILAGSQKFLLMKSVSDSLAGRASVLELEPLSFSEIRAAFPQMPLNPIILKGGYPELYDEPHLDFVKYYRSYFVTYLERDIRSLLNVGNLRDFDRFIRACALRSGQLLNKSELARDVGISATTANEWLSVLAASNQVYLLEPWFSNGSKSIVKSPKLYLADTGILLFLLGIRNEEELLNSPYLGSIWETFVFSEIRKRQSFAEGGWSLFFWRDRSKEVDFLIHRGGGFELLECKWTELPTQRDCKNLEEVSQILNSKRPSSGRTTPSARTAVVSQKIICRCPQSHLVTDQIRAQPIGDSLFQGDSSQ